MNKRLFARVGFVKTISGEELMRVLGSQEIDWNRIIAENVKEKYVPLNQQALQVGLELE